MKYKLPLCSPIKPTISQLYGDKTNVAWYHENGLNLSEHNGLDLISGDPIQTYGTLLVCPVPKAELSKVWWENSMSTKGNGIQIAWEENGDRFNMRCWHCSEVVIKKRYVLGDVIGFIGNSGLVTPKPIPESPFNGAHLHLMIFKNGVLIDPLEIFNKDEWFYTCEDSGIEKDVPPLFWIVEYTKKQIQKLLGLFST